MLDTLDAFCVGEPARADVEGCEPVALARDVEDDADVAEVEEPAGLWAEEVDPDPDPDAVCATAEFEA
ncbi:hypothetical protein [Catenulispora sp. GP43]|uniref:hypothetical protein n=1 Tax=Catenulispora sp. GP43 TaxID=3156263 RepID=UPI003513EB97